MGQTAVEAVIAAMLPELRAVVGQVLSQASRDGNTNLYDMVQAIRQKRNKLTAQWLQSTIEQLYAAELGRRTTHCPHCNKLLFRKRLQRRPLSTLMGELVLRRPYFYCRRCQLGFAPLDCILELAPELHQYDIQEEITALATRAPYEEAGEVFTKLTGVALSEHFAHRTVQAVGTAATAAQVLPKRAEIKQRIEQVRAGSSWRPVLVVTADGAHAPIRAPQRGRKHRRGPGQWHEVKGFRLFLLGRGGRIVSLAHWQQIGDLDALAAVLRVLAARIPTETVRTVLVGDGAPWLWKVLGGVFPDAVQVLDRYHCAQYLWRVAREQFADNEAGRWVAAILARLDAGEVPEAIGDVVELAPVSAAAEHKLSLLVAHLDQHMGRFDYTRCKRRGFPIGSGAMESANRFIMQVRIKRPGAWWLYEPCNTMLRIRCAIYNGTYKGVFTSYAQHRPDRQSKPLPRAA